MIRSIEVRDKRFPLASGAGTDAVHTNPVYSYAVTVLRDDRGREGTGFAFTLGEGNDLVCKAAHYLASKLVGRDIESMMANFGEVYQQLTNDAQFRWLGPQKGVVHLALASVTNACYDLWAKQRDVPLWSLLLSLSPSELVATLDLTFLEDVLTVQEATDILAGATATRAARMGVLQSGYPGYDTSVGWFNYSDEKVRENCKKAIEHGFTAMKLKVGSDDPERDIRRAHIVREVAGDEALVMLDANQKWNLIQATQICKSLAGMNPYWIEEPTHPDDVLAHQTLAHAIQPLKLALGEHVPNKILFKNYLQTQCAGFIQVDAVRVGGVSEFLTVSLLCKKWGVPVVPHVGDMGQLHQHLVLYNHIGMDHPKLFLEHIPHLSKEFVHPVKIEQGTYQTPMEPGSGCDLKA
jgi:L-fuconate dehydratase